MTRQIILDTETTGLNAATGDRVIEIGCVEMVNRRLTGRNLHFYINPEREIDAGAMAVHGITNEFVADKPKFAEIVNEIRDYVQGAEAIIHNAAFDLGFLDMEFQRLGLPPESSSAVSASGSRLAHHTSQRAPRTGILRTTRRKKMGRKPSTESV